MRKLSLAIAPVALLATLSACGGNAPEAEQEAVVDATDGEPMMQEASLTDEEIATVLHDRHELYEDMGDQFKAIRGQLESGSPDMAKVGEAAQAINAHAVEIKNMFPAGTAREEGNKTEALMTIWEQPEKFEEARLALLNKSEALSAAAASGDSAAVGNAVKELGGTCKNCHDTFRLPEDER